MSAMIVLLGVSAGCDRPSAADAALPGMEAQSRDRSLRYSIVPARDAVAVKDAKTGRQLAEVSVGKAPEQILVAPDDTIYVTNRGSRSVSVIARGAWKEAARISVGVEPVGLAVSPDNKTLYVVNSASLESADAGTLTAVDLNTNTARWEIPVGEEPRAVVVKGNTAEVVKKGGSKVRVDLQNARVVDEPKPAPPEPMRQGESPRADAEQHGTPPPGTLATIVH